jgi:hypothetical protein
MAEEIRGELAVAGRLHDEQLLLVLLLHRHGGHAVEPAEALDRRVVDAEHLDLRRPRWDRAARTARRARPRRRCLEPLRFRSGRRRRTPVVVFKVRRRPTASMTLTKPNLPTADVE